MDSSVALARAYLQINGFFVLTELPVQIGEGTIYRTATDIDLLAVRLPHEAELVPSARSRGNEIYLGEDRRLEIDTTRTEILIGEVKRGKAQLNPASYDVDVLRFALRRTGCCPPELIDHHARELARDGMVETAMPGGHPCRIRLVCFAGSVGQQRRGVLSVELGHCVAFMRDRLARYSPQLRGAYFHDPVLNLLSLIDALPDREKESLHAS